MEEKKNKDIIEICIKIIISLIVIRQIDKMFNSFIKKAKRTIPRIFISHSWSFDYDYRTLLKRFKYHGFDYYNHSISNDKAVNERNEDNIRKGIRNKMWGCSTVLFLAGENSNKFWIREEVRIAKELGKIIIIVLPRRNTTVPAFLRLNANKIVNYNAREIINSIKY